MSSISELLLAGTAANGGTTVSLEDATVAIHVRGYYVGGAVPSEVFPNTGDMSDYANAVTNITRQVQGLGYIGSWLDTETNTVYVDAVDWIEDRTIAIAVARDRGELAIWDIANGEEIRAVGTDPNATPIPGATAVKA